MSHDILFLVMFTKFEVCRIKLAIVRRNFAILFFLKQNLLPLQIPLLPQFLQQILRILHISYLLKYKDLLEVGFVILPPPPNFFNKTKSHNFIKRSTNKKSYKKVEFFKGYRGRKSKIRLLKALCNLIVSVSANLRNLLRKL